MHFVNLRLEGDYPIPTLSAVWKRYRNDAAGAWEMVYQERIQRYQSIIEGNKQRRGPYASVPTATATAAAATAATAAATAAAATTRWRGEPHQDVPNQHPERTYRAVRLPARVEALLQGIADSTQQLIQQQQLQIQQQQAQIQQQQVEHSQRLAHTNEQLTRRVDRLEDLISWHVHVELRHAQCEGIQLPAFPQPRDYPPPPPPPPPP
ncbi:hypothetical protein E3N88_40774 [Mikania micrantha]|uniref:Uncharacterized protein n=1 Tax=Mikania micrantha TaxID=192012 RepID=A0A5N6LNP5_9ASTR|nr:hypothetical protein E3N88_40774 [Mikania micrantha]